MKTFIKKYWLITLILIAAFFLRFYKLSSYPALNADEAAIGYNAYSIIKTGLDEHGNSWPIHFQSFNDYKPGLYFYLVLPLVKVMGLTELAVRLPNATLALATVFLVYLLVKELFGSEKFALTSALFLAISPWHIHFSRGGWEVNTATFFITLGVLMFLKALKKPSILSFIYFLLPFTLSLYTYHAARIVVPLICFGFLFIYKEEIFQKSNWKPIIISFAIGTAILLPLLKDLIAGDVLARAAGVGLFADKGPINRINEQRGEHKNAFSLVPKLLHNKVVNYSLAFLDNWSSHFSGEFLFLTGDDIERNKVPETGQMYLFDIIFLAAAFWGITRNVDKNWSALIWWLLVAPFAAALTFQAPHALRAENMVIPITIFSAYGFKFILDRKFSNIYIFAVFIFMIWNVGRYLEMYYSHMSKLYPYSSQYGVKELVQYVSANDEKYKDIIVTDRYDQPYILFLFYTKYPPEDFQFSHTLTSRDDFGFSTVREFGKYHFESGDFGSIKEKYPRSLIAGTPAEIPKEANIIKRIYGTNGFEYFDVVAN